MCSIIIKHKPTDKKRPFPTKELPVDALLFNKSREAELQKIYTELNNFVNVTSSLSLTQTTPIKSLNQRRTTIISLVHQESVEEKIPKQINDLNTQIVKLIKQLQPDYKIDQIDLPTETEPSHKKRKSN